MSNNHAEHADGYETTLELQKRFEHIRRVTRKESAPHMRSYPGEERFGNDYSGFIDFYSRDELLGLEKCFTMADHDKDGVLNDVELKYWMEKHNRPISNRDLKHILKIADLDGDGALSFKEFLFLCKKMELRDVGHGGNGAGVTIYDCFGEDNTSFQEIRTFVKQAGSYTQINAEVHNNVEYFEDRIANELLGPKPHVNKDIIPHESDSDFNLEEFCKDLKHPSEEIKEICNEKFGNLNNSEEQKRFRTELYIVPENNKKRSVNTRFSLAEDDAQVILPVNRQSKEKFEEDLINQIKNDPMNPNSFRTSVHLEFPSSKGNLQVDKEIQATLENQSIEPTIKQKLKQSIGVSASDHKHKVLAPDLQEDFETLDLNSPSRSINF